MYERGNIGTRIIEVLEKSDPRPWARSVVPFSGFFAFLNMARALETENAESLRHSAVSLFLSVLALAIAYSDYQPREME